MKNTTRQGTFSSNSHGITDLMTSLAIIFILLFAAFITQATSEAQSTLKEHKEDVQAALRDHLQQLGLSLDADPRDPLTLLIVVPENLLTFESDKSTLTSRADRFLEEVMPFYAAVVCGPMRGKIDSLAIQGHTDNRGGDVYNLHLSQARSLAVMVKALEVIRVQEPTAYQCFQEMTVAAGRGRQDLIYRPNHHVDHEKSRRVIFKIRLRSTEQRRTGMKHLIRM